MLLAFPPSTGNSKSWLMEEVYAEVSMDATDRGRSLSPLRKPRQEQWITT